MATKRCSKCHEEKPLSGFYSKTKEKGGKRYPCSNCKSCDAIRVNAYYRNIQAARKRDCVAYKGGKCARCGYNKCLAALEFHHREPNQKDVNIVRNYGRDKLSDKIRLELDKCDLLCANCHREVHEELGTNGRRRSN